MGAEHVLNSSEPGFDEALSKLARRLNATVCFEAISGSTTSQIMKAMPPKSIIIVYGLLSEQNVQDIDPSLLIARDQRLEGFFLGHWLSGKSTWFLLGVIKQASKIIADKTIHSEVAKRISLFEVREAIPEYKKNMTAGKYLIYPQQEQGHAGELPEPIDNEEEKKE